MKKKVFLGITAIILLIGVFVAYKVFSPAVSTTNNKYIYIRSGESLQSVKEQLTDKKILNNTQWFSRVASWLKFNTPKPGRYEMKKGMSLFALVKMLRSGNQSPVKIVVTKERTKELFSGKMGKKFDTDCDSLEMISFLSNNDSLKKYDVDTNTVMAVIMPYTYEVNWDSHAGKIFGQFYAAYKKFWTDEKKAKAASINLTPLEVSIMASIVEEETNKKEDKYNIASTYLNRLSRGMKLEADPTVKFITRNFQLGRIQGIHLRLESLYNTYQHTGLPPGPICTPSIETLNAVLDAPKTDYIFFVASDKFDGSSVFTTNYTDHLKYARLFQAEQKRRADSIQRLKQKQ